jgi:hypothetical protein
MCVKPRAGVSRRSECRKSEDDETRKIHVTWTSLKLTRRQKATWPGTGGGAAPWERGERFGFLVDRSVKEVSGYVSTSSTLLKRQSSIPRPPVLQTFHLQLASQWNTHLNRSIRVAGCSLGSIRYRDYTALSSNTYTHARTNERTQSDHLSVCWRYSRSPPPFRT